MISTVALPFRDLHGNEVGPLAEKLRWPFLAVSPLEKK
jgi:hypothetical protein